MKCLLWDWGLKMNKTVAFYNESTARHAEIEAWNSEMRGWYNAFMDKLPATKGMAILDAGAGLGDASRYFLARGHVVTAMEPAEKRCDMLREIPGLDVFCGGFMDVDWKDRFNGVWASASLLHVPMDDMSDAIARLAQSLKKDGILYASFIYGNGARLKADGRLFTDMNENIFADVVANVSGLNILSMQPKKDVRTKRDKFWLNCFCQKNK